MTSDLELLEQGGTFFPLPAGDKAPPPTGATGKYANAKLSTAGREALLAGACEGCNVGLLLGHRRVQMADGSYRGIFVLDEDNKPERTTARGDTHKAQHGAMTVAMLEADLGTLPRTLKSRTPGFGCHRLFWAPDDIFDLPAKILAKSFGAQCGLEVLTEGRYIVYPGSVLTPQKAAANGYIAGAYEWEDPTAPIAELPRKWIEYLLEINGGLGMTPVEELAEPPHLVSVPQEKREADFAAYLAPKVKEGAGDGSGQLIKLAAVGKLGFGCGIEGAARVLKAAAIGQGWSDDQIRKRCEDAKGLPLGCKYEWTLPPDLAHLAGKKPVTPIDSRFANDDTLPVFPVDVLPAALRDFVIAEAEATQTPIDMAAMLVLGCCSAAIAGKVEIEVEPGYREPLNLFTAVALPPAERKSSTFADVFRPLREAERAKAEASAKIISEARTQHDLLEASIKRTKSELAKLKPHEQEQEWKANQVGSVPVGGIALRRQIGEMEARLRKMEVPSEPQLIADDVTMERLAGLMAEQNGRMCIASPEGTIFGIVAGRYSRNGQGSFEVLLKGHAGDMLKVDRQSKDRPSVHLERPCLTLVLAVQPTIIQGLSADSAMRGQGLLARFLYSLPESRVGTRSVDVEPLPEAIRTAYHTIVRRLADVQTPQETATWGTQVTADLDVDRLLRASAAMGGHIPSIGLSDEAQALHRQFRRTVEPRLHAKSGDLNELSDWAGKWPGAVARIAGILHCAEHGAVGNVSGETMSAALAVGNYLLPHASKAFSLMQTPSEETDAQAILEWLKRKQINNFTVRELARNMSPRGVARNKKRRDSAILELLERGLIIQTGDSYEVVLSALVGNLSARFADRQNAIKPMI